MPTIAVNKAELFHRLGKNYSREEFDELCFEFGLELDEDTTEQVQALKESVRKGKLPKTTVIEEPQLKIEVPANRYDLLCIEGIARALNIFLSRQQPPQFRLVEPASGITSLTISDETSPLRPFAAAAILRNVTFTPASYASFIDLQDKLHANLCRKRQFVAIGTHDLDTITAPFTYTAEKPEAIKFCSLNQTVERNAADMIQFYESDKHLSKFLPLIKDSPVYPVMRDSNNLVLSMPPIINSEHSKITLNTKNIFIDLTATDETKLEIVTDIVCGMFSEYCANPYEIEPVQIIRNGKVCGATPAMRHRVTTARPSFINSCTGLSLSAEAIAELLTKMGLSAAVSTTVSDCLNVSIPPTRPDILHECDIMEDAAIAYGFNNLKKSFPTTNTVAKPFQINKLTDLVRKECAMAGWVEVLPLILCSQDENFAWLRKIDDGSAVRLANPKTAEYQVVRTSLLPGILKTLRENRDHALPIKVFECSDCAVQELSSERKSKNIRKVAAVWCNKTAEFEVVHGLLDRLMLMLGVPALSDKHSTHGYYISESEENLYFPGRAANIMYRSPIKKNEQTSSTTSGGIASSLDTLKSALIAGFPSLRIKDPRSHDQDVVVGSLGVLHPEVLSNFELTFPCSALEFNLESFM